jgi:hypothetical protein
MVTELPFVSVREHQEKTLADRRLPDFRFLGDLISRAHFDREEAL